MENNMVSIIVPVYNGEKYIKKCIESILSQTFQNIELIVIDDGSTDSTKSIIESFQDNRIKKIYIENSGVSHARNIGINNAKGGFVLFIDADDYIKNCSIEELYKLAVDTNVDIIRFNGYIENSKNLFKKLEFNIEDGKILDTNNSKDKNEIIELLNHPSKSMRCYSPLLFIKNSNVIKFRTDLKYLEDKVFYIENMLNNKKILFVNKAYYYYTNNTDSKTKKIDKFKENILDLLESKKYVLKIAKINDYNDLALINTSYGVLILYRLDYIVKSSNFSNTKRLLKELLLDSRIQENMKFDTSSISNLKKIQNLLLNNKLYFVYFIITKLKTLMKG